MFDTNVLEELHLSVLQHLVSLYCAVLPPIKPARSAAVRVALVGVTSVYSVHVGVHLLATVLLVLVF